MSETIEPAAHAGPISLANEPDFILGALEVRPSLRQVRVEGRCETVEPRVMQAFVALYRARGEVVARDELIRICWSGRVVGDDAINSSIAKVRAIAQLSLVPAFEIDTIARVGYRLRTEERGASEPAAQRPRQLIELRTLAAMVAVLVLGAGAGLLAKRASNRAPRAAASATRIAVLPFNALDPQQEARTFAEGVSDQIIDVLDDNQVQTVSRTDSAQLQGPDRDAVAGRLGAEFILDGTVQRGESGLHATVHLDDAATHSTLWTASLDEDRGGSLALQAEVAARAADVIMQVVLARAPGEAPIDDAALAVYLKASDNMRQPIDRPTMMRQVALHRQVLARAPGFSLAYSGLAAALALDAQFATPEEARGMREEAHRDAAKALTLNPKNGDAYFAEGLLAPEGDWAGRQAVFRRGLAVQPDNGTIQSWLADTLASTGQINESLSLKQRSLMNDPLSPAKTANLAWLLAANGRCTEAVPTIERAARTWPTYPQIWTARVYTLANCGRSQQARTVLDAGAARPSFDIAEPEAVAAWRAYTVALESSAPRDAATARRDILSAHEARQIGKSGALEMLARLGAVDDVFALAEVGLSSSSGPAPTPLPFDPAILFNKNSEAVRRDPRFMGLAARLGLADYWLATGRWPDFCEHADLPYDCRRAAERARGAADLTPLTQRAVVRAN